MAKVAEVYVDVKAYHIDKPYSYLIPDNFLSLVNVGSRVLVPFGNGNKKVQGYVHKIMDDNIDTQIKSLSAVLDKEPIIVGDTLKIVDFLTDRTFCSHYEAVKTVLPSGLNYNVEYLYKLKRQIFDDEYNKLSNEEKCVIEFLRNSKSEKEFNSFLSCKENPSKKQVVKKLIDKDIIEKVELLKQKTKKKTVKMVKLNEEILISGVRLTKKQKDVVEILIDTKSAMIKELCYLSGTTEAVVKGLEKNGVVSYYLREVEDTYEHDVIEDLVNRQEVMLNEEQEQAYNGIKELINDNKPNAALLYGVTGSGKTQVYIKLIDYCLSEGKTAMLLVPEISLTPQLLKKFSDYFGEIISVVHSNLSVKERYDSYNKMKQGKSRIVIGTRSAVFSPLENLGLVIMDEEGEGSYKSEATPRYHARDIVKLRCTLNNSTMLLGSATPSVETMYNAKEGNYKFFCLKDRYSNANLPEVFIVDMRDEYKNNNFSCLSEILAEQIARNLEREEQTIILLNRRGYNTYASCLDCGETIKCPNCDVALTYHKANGRLMCHYCGYTEKFSSKCPSCKGDYIKLTGLGTQLVENELNNRFPNARVLRMDADTTFSKYSYEKNFSEFKKGKYDILIGTQMIAKGLDFPNVTLVGVLGADNGLYSADFKSNERVFSLITQVVGRSGRSEKSGRAYIQTNEPDNEIINLAAKQDYLSFYESEIMARKMLLFPPYCDMLSFGFSGENEIMTEKAAAVLVDLLHEKSKTATNIAMKVLGVTQAQIYKINGKYRYRVIVKCKMNKEMRKLVRETLVDCVKLKELKQISVYADVNGDVLG